MAIANIGGTTLPENGSIAEITTARPFSLTNMNVNDALTLDAINRKLQIESTLDEIFLPLGADVVSVGKKVAIPNAIYLRLKAEAQGARSVTIPMLKPLQGTVRKGSETQRGYELPLDMRYAQFRYNEYSQAVAGEEWGVNANDLSQFNLYAQIQPQLSKYFKEMQGLWIRQALIQVYCDLLQDDISDSRVNLNWFVPGLSYALQPNVNAVQDTTTLQADLIADKIVSNATNEADGVAKGQVSLNYLLSLEHYAANVKRIDPISIGGKPRYIVLLPSPQYQVLRSDADNQMGAIWKDVSALSSEEASYPGVVGMVGNLMIVEDQRYCEMAIPDITADDKTLTFEYVNPGNDDNRTKAKYGVGNVGTCDLGVLMGQAAVCDWEVKRLHFEREDEEYGKKYGQGAFGERGIQCVEYRDDNAIGVDLLNFRISVQSYYRCVPPVSLRS